MPETAFGATVASPPGYLFTKKSGLLLELTCITIAAGLAYWAVVIGSQRARAWNLRQAASGDIPEIASPTRAAD